MEALIVWLTERLAGGSDVLDLLWELLLVMFMVLARAQGG